jgi:hypothetical protein
MKKKFAELAAAFSGTNLPPTIIAHETGRLTSQWISNYKCNDTGKQIVLSMTAEPISPLTGGNVTLAPRSKDKKITAEEIASLAVIAVLPDGTTLRSTPELANNLDGKRIYSPISGLSFIVDIAAAKATEESDEDEEEESEDDEEMEMDAEDDEDEIELSEYDFDESEDDEEMEMDAEDDEDEDEDENMEDDEEDEDENMEDDEEDEDENMEDDEEDEVELDTEENDDEDEFDADDESEDDEDEFDADDESEDDEDEDENMEDDEEESMDMDESSDDEIIAEEVADEDDIIETVIAETASLANIEVLNANGRLWVIAGTTPIATVDRTKCQPLQQKMLDKNEEGFARALSASVASSEGITPEIATAFGLHLLSHEVVVSKAVSTKIAAATKKAVEEANAKGKKFTSRFENALTVSLAGINKGVFEEVKSHPLKDALIESLSTSGVRNPERIIHAAFEKGGDRFLRLVIAKALSLASEDDDFIGRTAKFVKSTRAPVYASSDEEAASDFSDELATAGFVVKDEKTREKEEASDKSELPAIRSFFQSRRQR